MTAVTWDVRVDGTNIARIALEGATIVDGRRTAFDAPVLPLATVALRTPADDPSLAALWPEFTLGEHSVPSGFVDTYGDEYVGATSRITFGAPVTITARTPSGFVDTYSDLYAGIDLTRFTGHVQAIDWVLDQVRLTCIHPAEAWAHIDVGGTDDVTTIPEEDDTARVQRLCGEADVTITIHGTPGPDLVPIGPDTQPSGLLDQLAAIARDAGGLLTGARDGTVHYWTRTALADVGAEDPLALDADTVPIDTLALSGDLALCYSRVVVEYGVPDVDGNRPTVEATDDDVRVLLGGDGAPHRTLPAAVQLADEADAQAHAETLLAALAPSFDLPTVPVLVHLAEPSTLQAIAEIPLGGRVTVEPLPVGAPAETVTGPLIGTTETLTGRQWLLDLHLSTVPELPE